MEAIILMTMTMNIKDLGLDKILYMEDHIKIISFIVLCTEPHTVKNLRVLVLMRQVDTFKKVAEINLSLFYPNEKYNRMFDRIKYLISQKGNMLDVYYYNYMKIGINSDDDLPLKKH